MFCHYSRSLLLLIFPFYLQHPPHPLARAFAELTLSLWLNIGTHGSATKSCQTDPLLIKLSLVELSYGIKHSKPLKSFRVQLACSYHLTGQDAVMGSANGGQWMKATGVVSRNKREECISPHKSSEAEYDCDCWHTFITRSLFVEGANHAGMKRFIETHGSCG